MLFSSPSIPPQVIEDKHTILSRRTGGCHTTLATVGRFLRYLIKGPVDIGSERNSYEQSTSYAASTKVHRPARPPPKTREFEAVLSGNFHEQTELIQGNCPHCRSLPLCTTEGVFKPREESRESLTPLIQMAITTPLFVFHSTSTPSISMAEYNYHYNSTFYFISTAGEIPPLHHPPNTEYAGSLAHGIPAHRWGMVPLQHPTPIASNDANQIRNLGIYCLILSLLSF